MNLPLLEMSTALWAAVLADLRRQSRGVRESGCFLLGNLGETRTALEFVAYDELDPDSLNYRYVRLETETFAKLWTRCEERGLTVVADVHTHPFGPAQSRSDRANPMIALPGHLALIVPSFAKGEVLPQDLSVNVHLGASQWSSHFGADAAARLSLT